MNKIKKTNNFYKMTKKKNQNNDDLIRNMIPLIWIE